MYNILIASKMPMMIKGLSAIADEMIPIKTNIQIATSYLQMETKLATDTNQMLLLDLHLVDTTSVDYRYTTIFGKLIKAYPSVKIISFYDRLERNFFNWMYRKGVKGIIGRVAALNEIRFCIEKVYKKETYIEDQILLALIHTTQKKEHKKHYINIVKLTEKEKVVARLLIRGKNNTQICAILQLQPSTVSTFKQHVFKKLQIDNLVDLISVKKLTN